MKKVLMTFGALLLTSGLWAACMGPFCWDDRGAYINGVVTDGNGNGTPSMTKSVMNATAPTATGQNIYCSDCTRSALCISTGTAKAAYTVAVETGTMGSPTHCQ